MQESDALSLQPGEVVWRQGMHMIMAEEKLGILRPMALKYVAPGKVKGTILVVAVEDQEATPAPTPAPISLALVHREEKDAWEVLLGSLHTVSEMYLRMTSTYRATLKALVAECNKAFGSPKETDGSQDSAARPPVQEASPEREGAAPGSGEGA